MSGKHMLMASFSAFDPTETLAVPSVLLLMPVLTPYQRICLNR